MKLEYHPATVSDLNQAAGYYNDRRAGLGDEFRQAVYVAIDRIADSPMHFRVVGDSKRRCRVERFPYSVIFRVVEPDTVRILVVRHHRQRPEFGQRRS